MTRLATITRSPKFSNAEIAICPKGTIMIRENSMLTGKTGVVSTTSYLDRRYFIDDDPENLLDLLKFDGKPGISIVTVFWLIVGAGYATLLAMILLLVLLGPSELKSSKAGTDTAMESVGNDA